MNFTWPVFLVRADPVFVGIRCKHLDDEASKASPFYRAKQYPDCASRCQALSARTYIQFPTTSLARRLNTSAFCLIHGNLSRQFRPAEYVDTRYCSRGIFNKVKCERLSQSMGCGESRLLLRNTFHHLYNPVACESCIQLDYPPPRNSYHARSTSTRLSPSI